MGVAHNISGPGVCLLHIPVSVANSSPKAVVLQRHVQVQLLQRIA